jgi:DNA-directed RNA polymerase subunit E'/Rpb7
MSKITKPVHIEPKHLTRDIDEYIYSELKKKYERTCCEVGLIISIDEILEMDNFINKDSIIITFVVTFMAKTIKPEKNMIFSFIPSLILSKGVFGKLYDNINFFIPESNLVLLGYVFDTDKFVKKEEKVDCKNEIRVKIEQIKYDTVKYNCITQLV